MKLFAIRDGAEPQPKDLAYLLYFETAKQFYIELPENADEWETPLILSSFAKKGETSINSYWSRVWVEQRIIPRDRQNIAQILRDNGLKEYDEFGMLMLAMGRCAQDDYYLAPISEDQLPAKVLRRFQRKIEDVMPLGSNELLVFFRDGTIRRCDLTSYFQAHERFAVLLKKPSYFSGVQIQAGGYGIRWDDNLMISDSVLYRMGKAVPLSLENFKLFVAERTVNAAEASELLNCSRQYINELVKKGLLHPLKSYEKNTLFLKSEVLKRNWQ